MVSSVSTVGKSGIKQPTVPSQRERVLVRTTPRQHQPKWLTIDPQLATTEIPDDPMQYLHSDSDSSDEIRQVRVQNMGSQPHCAKINVQGVPVDGVVDSGANITIMGRDLFKHVATVAKLRKKDFKPPDKVPRNYDQPF